MKRLLNVTARVIRFAWNTTHPKEKLTSKDLTVEELVHIRDLWIMEAQREITQKDNFDDLVKNLGVIEGDDTLMRCKGQMQNAALPTQAKSPILFPGNSWITKLLEMQIHENVSHGGVNRTLAEVRTRYWIPKGRQTLKKLPNECLVCQQFSAKKLMALNIAPLPRMRVMQTRPFQHTGLDFAGPLMVKDGNQQSKAYVTLFTCATTRAVHLELAPDMLVGTFRQSLEKFVAKRGMPDLIVSDNAATFKSTAFELKELFDHPEVQTYLQRNYLTYLTWKFNLSLAPWWGGFYERIVGMTKGILRIVLGNSKLTFRDLEVILIKAESILNNRPLTYQSEELEKQALTPNHLIYGDKLATMPTVPEDCFSDDIIWKRKLYVEEKLNHVWSRWSSEYLATLREFHKVKDQKAGSPYVLSKGDLVLIGQPNKNCGTWKTSKVIRLIKGKDGLTRGAVMETITNGTKVLIERALQHLYPLEIKVDVAKPERKEEIPLRRSTTEAAKRANQNIKRTANELSTNDSQY